MTKTAIFVQDDGKIVHQKESERVSFRPNRGIPGGGSTSHPFGSLATQRYLWAHGFASPPRGEFAFVEDEEAKTWIVTTRKIKLFRTVLFAACIRLTAST